MFESFRDRKANQAPPQPEESRRTLQAEQHAAASTPPQDRSERKPEVAKPSAILSPQSPNPVARQLEMLARRAGQSPESSSERSKEETEIVESKEGQKLVVGPHIRLKGEVSNCDMLIIEGHFEGTAKSRVLQVAQGGSFQADAEVERAEMSGKYEGALTVRNRLFIHDSGRVSGTIQYFGIEVEQGGQISGNIQVAINEASNGIATKSSRHEANLIVKEAES